MQLMARGEESFELTDGSLLGVSWANQMPYCKSSLKSESEILPYTYLQGSE